MSFINLDKLGKTLTEKSKDVAQKAKDMTEIVRLTAQVNSEEDRLRAQYQAIGKAYYESHKDDENLMFAENFCVIEESLAKIAQYKAEIQTLKGLTVCPNCSAEVKIGTLFCSACGAKLPESEPEVIVDAPEEECCDCCCGEKSEEDSCECCDEKKEESCECCKEEESEGCTGTVE